MSHLASFRSGRTESFPRKVCVGEPHTPPNTGLTPTSDPIARRLMEGGDGDHESEDFASTASCPFNTRAGGSCPAGVSWLHVEEGNSLPRPAARVPVKHTKGDQMPMNPVTGLCRDTQEWRTAEGSFCQCTFLLSSKQQRRSVTLVSRNLHFAVSLLFVSLFQGNTVSEVLRF